MKDIPYKDVNFKVVAFYKYSRHPLYLGTLIGIWSTLLNDSYTPLLFILLTGYIMIGQYYEEKDLVRTFGKQYLNYKKTTPQDYSCKNWEINTKKMIKKCKTLNMRFERIPYRRI
jgi:methanethiol S-methyltransferase